MRAKFFLKGMGIGVTVTALIFTIAFALNPPTMSDEEIIARAKMLGMVESEEMEKVAEDSDEAAEASDETGTSDEAAEAESDEAGSDAAEGESADASDTGDNEAAADASEVSEEDALKALKEIQDSEAAEAADDTDVNAGYKTTDTVNDSGRKNGATPGDSVSFTVNQGEDSSTVAARLHRAGVIDDPTDFDLFLSENGFDTRIRPGSYNIPKGASYESIANAIAH